MWKKSRLKIKKLYQAGRTQKNPAAKKFGIGLDWIGLDWIRLDWIGLDWIGCKHSVP